MFLSPLPKKRTALPLPSQLEANSPCPGQHSHTLSVHRVRQIPGGCHSHPKLQCGPAQWILYLRGYLQERQLVTTLGPADAGRWSWKMFGWIVLRLCVGEATIFRRRKTQGLCRGWRECRGEQGGRPSYVNKFACKNSRAKHPQCTLKVVIKSVRKSSKQIQVIKIIQLNK